MNNLKKKERTHALTLKNKVINNKKIMIIIAN